MSWTSWKQRRRSRRVEIQDATTTMSKEANFIILGLEIIWLFESISLEQRNALYERFHANVTCFGKCWQTTVKESFDFQMIYKQSRANAKRCSEMPCLFQSTLNVWGQISSISASSMVFFPTTKETRNGWVFYFSIKCILHDFDKCCCRISKNQKNYLLPAIWILSSRVFHFSLLC